MTCPIAIPNFHLSKTFSTILHKSIQWQDLILQRSPTNLNLSSIFCHLILTFFNAKCRKLPFFSGVHEMTNTHHSTLKNHKKYHKQIIYQNLTYTNQPNIMSKTCISQSSTNQWKPRLEKSTKKLDKKNQKDSFIHDNESYIHTLRLKDCRKSPKDTTLAQMTLHHRCNPKRENPDPRKGDHIRRFYYLKP